MDKADFVVGTVTVLIVVTVIISGPLVPAVSLTEAAGTPQYGQYGQGSVSIENVSLPARGTLSPYDFGAANYNLVIPPATVHVASLTGALSISYSIEIPSLEYQRKTTLIFTDPDDQLNVTMGSSTVSSEHITQEQYHATLSLSVSDTTSNRTIATRNVTITVIE